MIGVALDVDMLTRALCRLVTEGAQPVAAPAGAASESTSNAALVALADGAATARRRSDTQAFSGRMQTLTPGASAADATRWLLGAAEALAAADLQRDGGMVWFGSWFTIEITRASTTNKSTGAEIAMLFADARRKFRDQWIGEEGLEAIWAALHRIVDPRAAEEFECCVRALPQAKSIASFTMGKLRSSFAEYMGAAYGGGLLAVAAAPARFSSPEALAIQLWSRAIQSSKVADAVAALGSPGDSLDAAAGAAAAAAAEGRTALSSISGHDMATRRATVGRRAGVFLVFLLAISNGYLLFLS